jgi:diguanylate cyclase (GGDEF)-like protein/PAS domain S-box-containing protein
MSPNNAARSTRWRGRLLSLRARLLLLTLLALAPAAALLIYNTAKHLQHDTAEVLENAQRLARNSALRQNELFDQIHQFLETLAQLQVVRDPAQHPNCNQVFTNLKKIHPRYVNFGVALPNGDIFCSAVPFKPRVNIADRPYFSRALATHDFAMSGLQTGRIIGKPTIHFGHPATNAHGEIGAFVFAALDLNWLNNILATTQLPEGAAITVVNSEGTITARYPDPEQWVGKTLPDAPLVHALLDQRGEGTALVPGLDGVRRLYAFATLSDKHARGHYITVGLPEEDAFGNAKRELARNVLIMAILGLATAALAWFGSDWLVLRRVNVLTDAAHRIGQGNLAARTGLPHTAEEFGQLARGFDEMAQSLEERERCLLESEAQLNLAQKISCTGGWDINMIDHTAHRTLGHDRIFGYESLLPHWTYEMFLEHVLPEDRAEVDRIFREAATTRTTWNFECRIRRADGEVRWIWVVSDKQYDGTGAVWRVSGSVQDITERKRAAENIQQLNTKLEQRVHELEHVSRALKTLSAGNRAMLHATDEQGLLDSMCRAIVDAGGYHMALVFYRNDDESRTLRPMAEAGYPGGLAALRTLKMTWADDEYGRGAVATAIRSGQPSVVRNMLTDPNYAPWRPHLHGSVSGVACPLRVDGEIIGALVVYAAEPDAFGLDEVKLLSESADDLAHGIATLRARAEQQRTQEAMHRLTRYDALTGLPNETQFVESLTAAIDTGERLNQSFALLQINIERLREINDALGFSHGDQLLREFGSRLSAAAPEPAVVARLRGDEFAVLLPDTNAGDAIEEVRRLEEVMARPFLIADIPLDVSSNIGIALFPEHGSTPHDLFRHMDMALQQAKKKGVGHDVFAPAQNQDQPRRLAMAGELRRAIEGGDLLLYLQPKVEIATGCVCGAEGLVRWQHAGHGLIPPVEFIGLAEHTGLIKPLTEWVIEAALRLNHAWQREGCALPIAVNLSARNLREEDLLEKIRRMMVTWGAGAGLLELEITESAVMEDAEFALRVLRNLRAAGIPLYIDDFGTGYSSLSYLQKLPVDYIKIDQSFVRDMSTSKDSLAIVRSTIDLAHDLGLKVVAEGVETQENWDQLAALGCGSAQGYFIAKPMPAGEFQNWVRQFRPPVTTPSERT